MTMTDAGPGIPGIDALVPDKLYTPDEAAALARLSPRRVREIINAAGVPVTRFPGSRVMRIRGDVLRALLTGAPVPEATDGPADGPTQVPPPGPPATQTTNFEHPVRRDPVRRRNRPHGGGAS